LGWLGACADLPLPLYERMVGAVLSSRALHTNDTTVKLQDPQSHQLCVARLWVYRGDAAHSYNVFAFTPNRKRDGPERFLAAPPRIVEVACKSPSSSRTSAPRFLAPHGHSDRAVA
jgi:hypothetical protein